MCDFECPTPCEHCGDMFDLHDGYGSEKWHKGIIICEYCHRKEQEEIERDEEIEECLANIADAEWTINNAKERLAAIGYQIATDKS